MKHTLSLIVVTVAILLLLFFVSSTGKKPPPIPQDATHLATKQEACIVCHAPGKTFPLKDTHPPKEQCLVCHKAEKG